MGFGRYRFRRSFGNVSSQFRGARPDTYPLFSGLLDQYGGASAAYSLRALSSGWLAGDVVEVRRSSFGGGDAQDTFTASQITSGAMLAWVTEFSGTADGFVSTWYDQSGNANNATQIATTSQPKIVDAGALVVNGIKFDGVDDSLDCGARILELSAGAASIFAVSDSDGQTSVKKGYMCSEGDSVGPYSSNYIFGANFGDAGIWVNTTLVGNALSATGNQLISTIYNGSTFQAYIDGATSGAASAATVNAEVTNTMIGSSGDGTTSFSGRKISELIAYKVDQTANAAAIFAEINAHYAIY